jgi:uncharacterized protein (TIGR02271 family)
MSKKSADQPQVIPLCAEELTVDKIEKLAARTVVTKSVSHEVVPVTMGLRHDSYEITRRSVGQAVTGEAPSVRQEGDAVIVPVLEERLVKQLFVAEEIVLTPKSSISVHREDVTVRRENVKVERSELSGNTKEQK